MKRKLSAEKYKLRVTAGPCYSRASHLPVPVNTSTPSVIVTRLSPLLLPSPPFPDTPLANTVSHQRTASQSSTSVCNPSALPAPPLSPPHTLTSPTHPTPPTYTPSSSPSRQPPQPRFPAMPLSLATTFLTRSARACRQASASCGRSQNGSTRACRATCMRSSRGSTAAFYRA